MAWKGKGKHYKTQTYSSLVATEAKQGLSLGRKHRSVSEAQHFLIMKTYMRYVFLQGISQSQPINIYWRVYSKSKQLMPITEILFTAVLYGTPPYWNSYFTYSQSDTIHPQL